MSNKSPVLERLAINAFLLLLVVLCVCCGIVVISNTILTVKGLL